jgi:hypothetical protein
VYGLLPSHEPNVFLWVIGHKLWELQEDLHGPKGVTPSNEMSRVSQTNNHQHGTEAIQLELRSSTCILPVPMQIGAFIKTAWLGYICNQLYLKLQPSLELISVLIWSYVSVNAQL